jgi:hypothetical protein
MRSPPSWKIWIVLWAESVEMTASRAGRFSGVGWDIRVTPTIDAAMTTIVMSRMEPIISDTAGSCFIPHNLPGVSISHNPIHVMN